MKAKLRCIAFTNIAWSVTSFEIVKYCIARLFSQIQKGTPVYYTLKQ